MVKDLWYTLIIYFQFFFFNFYNINRFFAIDLFCRVPIYNYIWLEAEDFSRFIGGKNGWEKRVHKGGILSGGNSIFSKAGAPGGKTVSKSFQINVSGEYTLWLRSKRYPFDFKDYNVSLDSHPSQNVYRDFHIVNEEFWKWLKLVLIIYLKVSTISRC